MDTQVDTLDIISSINDCLIKIKTVKHNKKIDKINKIKFIDKPDAFDESAKIEQIVRKHEGLFLFEKKNLECMTNHKFLKF